MCDNGVFSIPDLVLDDYSYIGPTGPGDSNDLCKCNTVVYSLMSACDACQGANWFSWNTWKHNCTNVDPLQTFSHTVPSGTRVQEWAFVDVTKKGIWDPVLSYQLGNRVEIIPGEPAIMTSIPAPTTTSTSVPGLSSSQAQYLLSRGTSSDKSRKIGAIVGGVLSGIAIIAAAVALFLWRARIKRRRMTRKAAEVIFANRALPMQEKVPKNKDQEEPHDVVAEAI